MDYFVWLVDGIFLRIMRGPINYYCHWLAIREALLVVSFIFLLAVWKIHHKST
jgi:hypothetical protein